MKINVNDIESLNVAFHTAQARCSARCMAADDPGSHGEQIEERLKKAGVLKKNLPGTTACIIERHGKIANAYKGTPYATQVQMVRGSTCWFVTCVTRVVYRHGCTELKLTDAAKADVARRLENY